MGVDVQAISPMPELLSYWMEAADAQQLLRYINEQIATLHAAAIDAAQYRRRHPQDDLMTLIVEAEVDGHRITDQEVGAFMVLLATAGNDTTKQTTSPAAPTTSTAA